MNSVSLVGRLTKNPEVKTTSNGTQVLSFCLAVNRNDQNKSTDFIDCKAFAKTAVFIGNYFAQGSPIEINGRITTRTYESDGRTVKVTEVLVHDAGFALTNKKQESDNGSDDDVVAF